jgi:signal transduction histidine kinase
MYEREIPTYDELKALCDNLQRQITRSLVVKQDLIDTRSGLDRDLARFKAIQSYSQKVIHAANLQDFAEITVESIIEAFELECSALLLYDKSERCLKPAAVFGLGVSEDKCRLDWEWLSSQGLLKGRSAYIEHVQPEMEPWCSAGLYQVIISPFYDGKEELEGLLLGGISTKKQVYYDEIKEESVPSFMVFTQQMSSLLHNLESQQVIRDQVEALTQAYSQLQEKTEKLQTAQKQLEETNRYLKRMVNELSSLHATGTAITSILDMDHLLDTVLKTIVHDLGYDRAMILLVDEQRNVLKDGRGMGTTEEMDDYIKNLERPIRKGGGVLVQVVMSGSPVLVSDVKDTDMKIDMDIVRTLKTKSFLAVPLKTKEKVIGVMAVDNFKSKAKLTERDERLLSTLAGQVAISIENARLYDRMRALNADLEQEIVEHKRAEVALQEAHDELELRVNERTIELSDANRLLKQEVVERKRVELELQEAKELAEEANRAKSDFLANMSHELRTPMNSVIGFSEMIIDGIYGQVPSEIREVVGEIQKSGEHLLGLINDVLDISKIEAGRMELRLSENAAEDCVETVLARMTSLAKEKGLDLIAEIGEELPLCTFDLQRITQVLYNLVGNAIKFTRKGEIRIGAKEDGENLLFWVADTGVGIPESELENIFSEFQQADSSITRDNPGSGLGLAIAKRFVEMHGGSIWVESKVGVGSTFWFTLPLRSNK